MIGTDMVSWSSPAMNANSSAFWYSRGARHSRDSMIVQKKWSQAKFSLQPEACGIWMKLFPGANAIFKQFKLLISNL